MSQKIFNMNRKHIYFIVNDVTNKTLIIQEEIINDACFIIITMKAK